MKPFPDIIPATEDQWRDMYHQYLASVERRRRRLAILEVALLVAGAVLLATAILLGPTHINLSVALIALGMISILIVVPVSEYTAHSTARLEKAIDRSDAARYWELRIDAKSYRSIGQIRKVRGIDPEGDYYYDNLARRHDAEADALLAAHKAKGTS